MVNERSSQSGVVLIAIVFLAFVVSITLAALARLWETDSQRDKERELRWAGRQFGKALGSYALVTPEGQTPMPKSLEELLLDTRVDPPMRHLRRIPLDPMTGKADWGTCARRRERSLPCIPALMRNRWKPTDCGRRIGRSPA